MRYLRQARSGDLAALNEICVRTAAYGSDVTSQMSRPELVGAVYADPYLLCDPASCFVVSGAGDDDGAPAGAEGEVVLGYVVGTLDTAGFRRWFAGEYAPARLAELGLAEETADPSSLTARDRSCLRLLRAPAPDPEPWLGRYPAHLHIDLLEPVRRQGWGRQLVEAWVGHARASGVAGLHLDVGADNTGAIAFYEAIGLQRIGQDDDGVTMARSLAEE
ncbi:GNAT family N-acetyltransferase [Actinomyces faecalis]|uniref:GNAT family N-acetyltransferase n=1 Tax=Actinomyces faecalis TaxID=2722820 RepID=UPI00155388B2|nr:GNAT family N-acetyltransferase [Actinomyces faecalis]